MMRRFCLEYLKDKNGAKAAIRAGYAKRGARKEAWRLLKTPKIQKYIRSVIEDQESRIKCDADRVLKELIRIGFFNGAVLQKVANGELELSDLTLDEQAAISEYSRQDHEHGSNIKVKAHPKNPALTTLAKHFSLFKEEGDDKTGTPILILKYPNPGES